MELLQEEILFQVVLQEALEITPLQVIYLQRLVSLLYLLEPIKYKFEVKVIWVDVQVDQVIHGQVVVLL
jgi:hypothetical protein